MSKKATTSESASVQPEPQSYTVTAHLSEAGDYYKPGDSIQLTPDRAAALGAIVTLA